MREFGLPPNAIVPALAAFNIGVEIGQVAIVSIVVPLLILLDRLFAVDRSGVDGAAGETPIGNGYERIFQGGPPVYTLVLQNGTTAAQAQLYVLGTSSCSLFGSAVPLSTS